jgi:hypothetical protein
VPALLHQTLGEHPRRKGAPAMKKVLIIDDSQMALELAKQRLANSRT